MVASETHNLSVILRVRPPNEHHGSNDRIVHVLDKQMVILTDPRDEDGILRAKRSREKRYMFDIAFDSYNSQLDVYLATTKPLISAVLDGVNATVFAYGPTGTGKTYTMLGTGDHPGTMSLALNEIFALINKGSEKNIYTVTMSYLEVYNELIRDLLHPDSGDLELREDSAGVTVAGLSEVEARSTDEVMDMLRAGNKRRTTEPTSVNKTSSRSHAVLQVTVKRLTRVRSLEETISMGKLYMIDLAGSERATHTKNRGTRLVEGAHINRSLLALGNCIKALSHNTTSYVNYRDSKLTRLLKDSLGGNCKTVMIAHVSPDKYLFDESRNTLQYADRAKRIKTKIRPNLHTVSHHVAKYPIIVEELHKEIARLKEANKNADLLSLESCSGVIPTKDRELLEGKRGDLMKVYNKQLKLKTRMARVDGNLKVGSYKTGHLQTLLHQHMESKALYGVLPPIDPDNPQPEVEIEKKEIEIQAALRQMSAKKRRGDTNQENLLVSWTRLADKYRAFEEDIEDKILDEDHREILTMLSTMHTLELQHAGAQLDVTSLEKVVEEQGHWLKSHNQFNLDLLEMVKMQHELLQTHAVEITPELNNLYRRLQERDLKEYSVLPGIGSRPTTADSEGDNLSSIMESLPPTPTTTINVEPVFMKTYNVGDGMGSSDTTKMEREMSQTIMHVLSTPSLTGGRASREGTSHQRSTTNIKENSTLLTPHPGASRPEPPPGKQATRAKQLQRLRTLRTEPVLAPQPKPKPRNRNNKPNNKNTFTKPELEEPWARKRNESLKNMGATFFVKDLEQQPWTVGRTEIVKDIAPPFFVKDQKKQPWTVGRTEIVKDIAPPFFVKESHAKMAEKAKIYGAPISRTPATRNRRALPPPQKKGNNSLSVTGVKTYPGRTKK